MFSTDQDFPPIRKQVSGKGKIIKQTAVQKLLQIQELNKYVNSQRWHESNNNKNETGPTALEWGTAKETEKFPPASFWERSALAGGRRQQGTGKAAVTLPKNTMSTKLPKTSSDPSASLRNWRQKCYKHLGNESTAHHPTKPFSVHRTTCFFSFAHRNLLLKSIKAYWDKYSTKFPPTTWLNTNKQLVVNNLHFHFTRKGRQGKLFWIP